MAGVQTVPKGSTVAKSEETLVATLAYVNHAQSGRGKRVGKQRLDVNFLNG